MKIDKVKFSLGKTVNLGNYESLRLDIGLEANVENDYKEALYELVKKCMTELELLEKSCIVYHTNKKKG